ncbi:hypothetical protein AVW11_10880 [Streptomyces amritsarensis]|uniref:Uncharacterized protein n=1 Tax=Streptomyces amritsarensis TaxID=681158 RepID=A0ABX3G4P9_9ACTN|nr:hypothetical protein AVW11_10880 [Streptomyces amritsarensis]
MGMSAPVAARSMERPVITPGATRRAPTAMAALSRARRWMLVMTFSLALRGSGGGRPAEPNLVRPLRPATPHPSRHGISGLDTGAGR